MSLWYINSLFSIKAMEELQNKNQNQNFFNDEVFENFKELEGFKQLITKINELNKEVMKIKEKIEQIEDQEIKEVANRLINLWIFLLNLENENFEGLDVENSLMIKFKNELTIIEQHSKKLTDPKNKNIFLEKSIETPIINFFDIISKYYINLQVLFEEVDKNLEKNEIYIEEIDNNKKNNNNSKIPEDKAQKKNTQFIIEKISLQPIEDDLIFFTNVFKYESKNYKNDEEPIYIPSEFFKKLYEEDFNIEGLNQEIEEFKKTQDDNNYSKHIIKSYVKDCFFLKSQIISSYYLILKNETTNNIQSLNDNFFKLIPNTLLDNNELDKQLDLFTCSFLLSLLNLDEFQNINAFFRFLLKLVDNFIHNADKDTIEINFDLSKFQDLQKVLNAFDLSFISDKNHQLLLENKHEEIKVESDISKGLKTITNIIIFKNGLFQLKGGDLIMGNIVLPIIKAIIGNIDNIERDINLNKSSWLTYAKQSKISALTLFTEFQTWSQKNDKKNIINELLNGAYSQLKKINLFENLQFFLNMIQSKTPLDKIKEFESQISYKSYYCDSNLLIIQHPKNLNETIEINIKEDEFTIKMFRNPSFYNKINLFIFQIDALLKNQKDFINNKFTTDGLNNLNDILKTTYIPYLEEQLDQKEMGKLTKKNKNTKDYLIEYFNECKNTFSQNRLENFNTKKKKDKKLGGSEKFKTLTFSSLLDFTNHIIYFLQNTNKPITDFLNRPISIFNFKIKDIQGKKQLQIKYNNIPTPLLSVTAPNKIIQNDNLIEKFLIFLKVSNIINFKNNNNLNLKQYTTLIKAENDNVKLIFANYATSKNKDYLEMLMKFFLNMKGFNYFHDKGKHKFYQALGKNEENFYTKDKKNINYVQDFKFHKGSEPKHNFNKVITNIFDAFDRNLIMNKLPTTNQDLFFFLNNDKTKDNWKFVQQLQAKEGDNLIFFKYLVYSQIKYLLDSYTDNVIIDNDNDNKSFVSLVMNNNFDLLIEKINEDFFLSFFVVSLWLGSNFNKFCKKNINLDNEIKKMFQEIKNCPYNNNQIVKNKTTNDVNNYRNTNLIKLLENANPEGKYISSKNDDQYTYFLYCLQEINVTKLQSDDFKKTTDCQKANFNFKIVEETEATQYRKYFSQHIIIEKLDRFKKFLNTLTEEERNKINEFLQKLNWGLELPTTDKLESKQKEEKPNQLNQLNNKKQEQSKINDNNFNFNEIDNKSFLSNSQINLINSNINNKLQNSNISKNKRSRFEDSIINITDLENPVNKFENQLQNNITQVEGLKTNLKQQEQEFQQKIENLTNEFKPQNNQEQELNTTQKELIEQKFQTINRKILIGLFAISVLAAGVGTFFLIKNKKEKTGITQTKKKI